MYQYPKQPQIGERFSTFQHLSLCLQAFCSGCNHPHSISSDSLINFWWIPLILRDWLLASPFWRLKYSSCTSDWFFFQMNMEKSALFCWLKCYIYFMRWMFDIMKSVVAYVICYDISIWRTLFQLAGTAGYHFWILSLAIFSQKKSNKTSLV